MPLWEGAKGVYLMNGKVAHNDYVWYAPGYSCERPDVRRLGGIAPVPERQPATKGAEVYLKGKHDLPRRVCARSRKRKRITDGAVPPSTAPPKSAREVYQILKESTPEKGLDGEAASEIDR